MPLAVANRVNHIPAILSRMPLAEANRVNLIPAILSRMPLPEANLGNTLGLFTLNTIFIIIRFTRRILNCISSNRRENHAHASPVSRPPLTEDPILVAPPESQGSLFLLSIHVHFLIITYIHISCIFSELMSQYTSVRMTQFFYILIYSIHMKVYCCCSISNCYCPISNCYCPIFNCYCLTLNRYCLTFPTVTV